MSDKIFPDSTDLQKIMEQIKAGKEYVDYESEYYHGENRTFYYNPETKGFMIRRIDIIIGAYMHEENLTERLLIDFLSEITLYDFRESGFEV